MTFIHPLLFGGMALVGVPILLHLLMRQKPKHLLFPAFRFLQIRAKTNQRKIRLKHLLLLLLRMALIAILCLALIRPRLFSTRVSLGGNQDVAVALVVDASASMDYAVAGTTRLEAARQRAQEVLDEVGPNSRVLVIDGSPTSPEWGTVAQARAALAAVALRPGMPPVTSGIAVAWQKFDELDRTAGANENEALPRFLYVFSDRTAASWDMSRLADLQAQRDRLPPPVVQSIFMDVGVDKPVDVAIIDADVKPAIVPSNQEAVLRAHVQAAGQGCDTEILCRLVGENAVERKPVRLDAGQTQVFEFRRKGLPPGQYQAEITLATADALTANNIRYVTFEVRGPRRTLTITDDPDHAVFWQLALNAHGDFESHVKSPAEITSVEDLKPYLAVCLLSVKKPNEPVHDSLWGKLDRYVNRGGHLVIVPGRMDTAADQYNAKEAAALMPGRLEKTITAEAAAWRFNFKHLFMTKFKEWRDLGTVGIMKRTPTARRYWQVTAPSENVIVYYADKADKDSDPALLERSAGRPKGSGRVLLLTTPLDRRDDLDERPWNDYLATDDRSPFIVVLANEVLSYMVGDKEEANFNFVCGQIAVLPVPPAARAPEYVLDGPGITGAETRVTRAESEGELRIRQTQTPGNLVVSGGSADWKSRFSLNPGASEFQFDRIPAEEIEKLLGAGAVVPTGHNKPLRELLATRMKQPLELLPWLMGLLVLGLALEALLSNRFYKDENPPTPPTAPVDAATGP